MTETPQTLTQQSPAPGATPATPNPGSQPPPAAGVQPPATPGGVQPSPFHVPKWNENPTLGAYANQLGKFADPEKGVLDVEKLGKAYGELERYKGGPAPEPLTAEQFTKAIGEVQVPEGMNYPPEMREQLASLALEKGIAPEAFTELEKAMLDQQVRQYQAFEDYRKQEGQKAFDELEREIGGGKMAAYLDNAKRAAESLGFELDVNERTPERVQEIKAFAHIAEKIGEAKMPGSGTPTQTGGSGGVAAADDIANNPANPWHAAFKDPNHPQHEDAHRHHDQLLYEATKSGNVTFSQGGKV